MIPHGVSMFLFVPQLWQNKLQCMSFIWVAKGVCMITPKIDMWIYEQVWSIFDLWNHKISLKPYTKVERFEAFPFKYNLFLKFLRETESGPLFAILCIDNVSRNYLLRGKFLEKPWCYFSGRVWQGYLVLIINWVDK